MANCILCGNKTGFMENLSQEFPDERGRGVCSECHKKFRFKIEPEINDLIREGKDVPDIAKIVSDKFASTLEGKEYIDDYVETKKYQILSIKKKIDEEKAAEIDTVEYKAEMQMVTTGINFEGYKILEYKGIISGDTVIGTGIFSELFASTSDFFGKESNAFSNKMLAVKQSALTKLKMQSVIVGANAIIGVDFDYVNFSNNLIGISANGTAVIIEKIEGEE